VEENKPELAIQPAIEPKHLISKYYAPILILVGFIGAFIGYLLSKNLFKNK
jgi:hypothetical protein